jgi:hypothetical protein
MCKDTGEPVSRGIRGDLMGNKKAASARGLWELRHDTKCHETTLVEWLEPLAQ